MARMRAEPLSPGPQPAVSFISGRAIFCSSNLSSCWRNSWKQRYVSSRHSRKKRKALITRKANWTWFVTLCKSILKPFRRNTLQFSHKHRFLVGLERNKRLDCRLEFKRLQLLVGVSYRLRIWHQISTPTSFPGPFGGRGKGQKALGTRLISTHNRLEHIIVSDLGDP